jgi:hypothetical protein
LSLHELARHQNEKLELVFNPGMAYLVRMNWSEKPLLFGLGGLLLATAARGDVNPPGDNSYHVVVERNAFGLSPPKAAPLVTNTLPPVKVDVKFTGITSDKSGGKKAWLVVPPPPNNRTQNPQFLSMREGESQGDIQVLEIDDKENTVKIVNAGVQAVLTFKDNGYATPTMAAMPGNPLMPHGIPGIPTPGALPNPGILPAPGIVPAPTTPGIKTAGVTPTGNPANDALAARYGLQTTVGNTPGSTPVRTIPTRTLRTTVEPQAQSTAVPADPMVQHIMREAQKMQTEQQQGIAYPPLPPPPGVGK